MSELKPCPFCGSSNIEMDWGSVFDLGAHTSQHGFVECKACEASIFADSFDDDKSDADLIKLWNTRALTPKQQCADEMYELLNEARDFIASDPTIGPCGLGLVCVIDDLLAKARGEA